MAAPLLAEPRVVTIPREYVVATPISSDDVGTRDLPGAFHTYDLLGTEYGGGGIPPTLGIPPVYQTGTSWSNFVGDDIQSTNRTFTHFHWIYFDSRIGPLSQTVFHSSIIGFSCNPNASSATFAGPLKFRYATDTATTYSAVLLFTGLSGATAGNPGGGWIYSLLPGVLTFLAPGADFWVWQANNEVPGFLSYAARRGTPIPGATHDFMASSFSPFTASPTASFFTITHTAYPGEAFNLRFATGIPEPVTLLLAAGGLLILRRRR
jgi:hypothetical protein